MEDLESAPDAGSLTHTPEKEGAVSAHEYGIISFEGRVRTTYEPNPAPPKCAPVNLNS
jgi:hypothetical protein